MVEMALDKLEQYEKLHLDEERKASMVSNLLRALQRACGSACPDTALSTSRALCRRRERRSPASQQDLFDEVQRMAAEELRSVNDRSNTSSARPSGAVAGLRAPAAERRDLSSDSG